MRPIEAFLGSLEQQVSCIQLLRADVHADVVELQGVQDLADVTETEAQPAKVIDNDGLERPWTFCGHPDQSAEPGPVM